MSSTARDALSQRVIRVTAEARPDTRMIVNLPESVFAVFAQHADGAASDRFMGLVSGRRAASFPQRIFEDLIDGQPGGQVPPEATLDSLCELLDSTADGAIAVVDDAGEFVGAVTRESLLGVLHRRQQQMFDQSFELHEQQRRLIAAEIHDGLTQYATGARMQLEAFVVDQVKIEPKAAEHLNEAFRLLDETVAASRRLISQLHPTVLDQLGLEVAIETLIERHEQKGQLRIEFVYDDVVKGLHQSVELTVYRIIQESLNNIARHSGSRKARVALQRSDDWLQVEIRDWGSGFDLENIADDRYGLHGIRHRANILGGYASIVGDAQPGACIRVNLPLGAQPFEMQPLELPPTA